MLAMPSLASLFIILSSYKAGGGGGKRNKNKIK
jgi:hypothetical protein